MINAPRSALYRPCYIFYKQSRRKALVNERYQTGPAKVLSRAVNQLISIAAIIKGVVAYFNVIKIEGGFKAVYKKSGILNLFADLIEVYRNILFKGDHKYVLVKIDFDIAYKIKGP